jgi:hypothetical protein
VRPPRPHDVIHRVGLALEHSTSAIASPSAVGGSPTHTTRSRGASAQETSRIGPLLSPKHNHTTKWCTTPASTFPLAIYERVVGDVGFTVAVALTRTRAGKTGGTCRFTHICPQPRVHHKNVHFINLFLAFETSHRLSPPRRRLARLAHTHAPPRHIQPGISQRCFSQPAGEFQRVRATMLMLPCSSIAGFGRSLAPDDVSLFSRAGCPLLVVSNLRR